MKTARREAHTAASSLGSFLGMGQMRTSEEHEISARYRNGVIPPLAPSIQ